MELLFLFVLIPLEMWLLFTVDQKKLSYGKRAIAVTIYYERIGWFENICYELETSRIIIVTISL